MDMAVITAEAPVEPRPVDPPAADPGADFDFKQIAGNRLVRVFTAVFNWITNYPQHEFILPIFCWLFPILHVFNWAFVFRDEDVREVLSHSREFPVWWAPKMIMISGDKNFVLGMPEGPEYRLNYAQLAAAFPRDDVPNFVAPLAEEAAERILNPTHRLDAVRDLIWMVPAKLCEDYYGLHVPDKVLLAKWSLAISAFMFGVKAQSSKGDQQLAMQAAAGFGPVIRDSIRATREGHCTGVVLPRLIEMNIPDEVIVAHLFGMVTGFVPTNLLAGGNILETLLRHEKFMQQARQAALADDDDLLWRCLRETLRFRHINLGPFRSTASGGYTLAAGTFRQEKLPADTHVWALTQSAMFDGRRIARPRQFNPNRAAEDYLIFGYGQHWCLGSYIAKAQLTQTFKALLRRKGLRRASDADGRMKRIATFPDHLTVEYDS